MVFHLFMKWIEPGLCYCQQVVSILPLFLCNAGSYKYFVVTHERNFYCLKYFAKEEVILCLWFDAMWPAQSGKKRTKQLKEKKHCLRNGSGCSSIISSLERRQTYKCAIINSRSTVVPASSGICCLRYYGLNSGFKSWLAGVHWGYLEVRKPIPEPS